MATYRYALMKSLVMATYRYALMKSWHGMWYVHVCCSPSVVTPSETGLTFGKWCTLFHLTWNIVVVIVVVGIAASFPCNVPSEMKRVHCIQRPSIQGSCHQKSN